MKAEELRSLQAPLKARYREDPASALGTLSASATLLTGPQCRLDREGAQRVAGLHPKAGGDGKSACSGDLLLDSLVACAGVTLGAVAIAIGVEIRNGKVHAQGDLDFRGTLGVSKDVPVGFSKIRLRFEVDSDTDQDKLDSLLKLTERYCVVYQTLAHSAQIECSIGPVTR
jgi:uncharacterized OsmC-like protein